ncbi:hypothetical protein E2C01_032121 [Portunus trituberculatus]|uniref:Uncharacterized protein n=1 Tax=Portunus trituberculatus TaxID=210409 RepID=A0A5B7EUJ6_PORTR|nr:hypothetical protein [Portunus trituberculatus]
MKESEEELATVMAVERNNEKVALYKRGDDNTGWGKDVRDEEPLHPIPEGLIGVKDRPMKGNSGLRESRGSDDTKGP